MKYFDLQKLITFQLKRSMRQKSHSENKKAVGKFIIYQNQILGEGAFGTTCVSKPKADPSQRIACKILNKNKIEGISGDLGYIMNRVRDEVKAWKELDHPNIVKFEACEQTKNNVYFFQQLCPDGSLDDYIYKNRLGPKSQQIISFTKQIIDACIYLQSKGIVHRDIKPANILLKNGVIKLADFGLARVIKEDNNSETMKSFFTFAGTLHFMAPQILRHNKYSPKCDVWSVGITLYLMFTSELPFKVKPKDQSEKLLLDKIMGNKLSFEYRIFEENPKIVEILMKMLEFDEEKRPKMSELKDFFE